MELPVFPLGTALLPGLPLALRLFEPRYLAMLSDAAEAGEFGVVLIERGFEVGGGDARFDIGTLARLGGVSRAGSVLNIVARGTQRFVVDAWLPDDPYPRASATLLDDLVWDEAHRGALAATERVVRQALARAGEFGADTWPASVGLSEDPVLAAWQLAGIVPVGEFDRLGLLRAASVPELLELTAALAREAW